MEEGAVRTIPDIITDRDPGNEGEDLEYVPGLGDRASLPQADGDSRPLED